MIIKKICLDFTDINLLLNWHKKSILITNHNNSNSMFWFGHYNLWSPSVGHCWPPIHWWHLACGSGHQWMGGQQWPTSGLHKFIKPSKNTLLLYYSLHIGWFMFFQCSPKFHSLCSRHASLKWNPLLYKSGVPPPPFRRLNAPSYKGFHRYSLAMNHTAYDIVK